MNYNEWRISMFEVFIKELELYAYHGVSAAEREVGHRYLVSVWVTVDGSADASDDVSDTVDYGALAGVLSALVTVSRFSTVERVASACCEEILDVFPSVQNVKVSVSKIAPPMPFVAKEAGAVVEGRRSKKS